MIENNNHERIYISNKLSQQRTLTVTVRFPKNDMLLCKAWSLGCKHDTTTTTIHPVHGFKFAFWNIERALSEPPSEIQKGVVPDSGPSVSKWTIWSIERTLSEPPGEIQKGVVPDSGPSGSKWTIWSIERALSEPPGEIQKAVVPDSGPSGSK